MLQWGGRLYASVFSIMVDTKNTCMLIVKLISTTILLDKLSEYTRIGTLQ